jgi:hypothetical protein
VVWIFLTLFSPIWSFYPKIVETITLARKFAYEFGKKKLRVKPALNVAR